MALSRAFLANLKVFSLSVEAALSFEDVARDLDVIELWAGTATVASAAQEKGLHTAIFDIKHDPADDMCCLTGFRAALQAARRLRPGGLLMMGPPCSSFVWMNLANTKRSQANDFEGDWSSGVVHEGNLHLDIAVFFFAYTLVRGAVPVVENPERSLMWETGAMKTLRAAASAGGTRPTRLLHSGVRSLPTLARATENRTSSCQRDSSSRVCIALARAQSHTHR